MSCLVLSISVRTSWTLSITLQTILLCVHAFEPNVLNMDGSLQEVLYV